MMSMEYLLKSVSWVTAPLTARDKALRTYKRRATKLLRTEV